MIDLHIHTTTSDGSDEPEEILVKAQLANLKCISITDHDSIGAYKKLDKHKLTSHTCFNGKILPGCEFSVGYNGTPIEILGYGIDLEMITKTGIVSDEKFLERENQNLKKLMEACKSIGVKYTKSLSIDKDKYFATQVIHSDFKKYPENEKLFSKDVWKSLNTFYRTCVNSEDNPFYLNQLKDLPTLKEVTDLIRNAGGKSFLAHLYGYYVPNHEEFLDSIVSLKQLNGIECYHSLHSLEKTKFLLDYCSKHNLNASGGSDYHGTLKPNVKVGESIPGVNIPYSIAMPWLADYLM
jgi:predicted metal-dependent phosphoesterase TrpH